MEEYVYVGFGPWKETEWSKDFDRCLQYCHERWDNQAYGWYILKMTKDQHYAWNKERVLNIDACEIVWDDFHIAPSQKELEFKQNLIFSKPLKSHK